MSGYIPINLSEDIVVDNLYSFSYAELTKDYISSGEEHDFWEMVYVDKGEVEITNDNLVYDLRQGDLVFYAPNEFHSLRCNRPTPPNIFIISFACRSPAMRYFVHKSIQLIDEERQLLSVILEEGQHTLLRAHRLLARKRRPEGATKPGDPEIFGSEQLVKNHLEILLIRLIRRGLRELPTAKLSMVTKQKEEEDLAAELETYIEEHLAEQLTLSRLCSEFSRSKSHLTSIFRKHRRCGIMEYWGKCRIEKAKQLIREERCNVTEISERLGYGSVHYFSRQFKKMTGTTPTEYLRKLQARL